MGKSPNLLDEFDSSSKKNEGRAQASSRLKLVERADPEVPQADPPVPAAPAAPAPENGFKLDWKIPTVIGTTLAVNGLLAWALVSAYKARKKANQSNSATPRNSDAYEPPNGYSPNEVSHLTHGTQQTTDSLPDATQQTFTGQPTNPPSTNNDPNSRREERPRGRRSPVSSELHPESRIDAVADGIFTTTGFRSQALARS